MKKNKERYNYYCRKSYNFVLYIFIINSKNLIKLFVNKTNENNKIKYIIDISIKYPKYVFIPISFIRINMKYIQPYRTTIPITNKNIFINILFFTSELLYFL